MDGCENNCDLGTDQVNNQLLFLLRMCATQKNEKELRLVNIFYTSTLLDSLIIKLLYTSLLT